ncbi:helix-turn-helix transcriptional regulator [Alcanivorax sp. 1008]|uniref:helix-turn-helix domain-containing protein n=1 Tax=Alcanivorax sp. 1008 TaxID=2816853 RepID=UPI001D9EC45B|nr:helix-turn-helix transcriptional regulator [Alcanivorax sp. 1008]MCC1496824.1 hypothetical protein [Alcanivorax sp. 1008]
MTQERMQERTGITNYSRIENGMTTTVGRLARLLEEFDAQRTLLKVADPATDADGIDRELANSKTRAFIQVVGDAWQPGEFGDELINAVRANRAERNFGSPPIPKRVDGDPSTSNRTPPLKPATEGVLERLGLHLEVARIRRGFTARQLIDTMASRGNKMSRNTLSRLEAGDPRTTIEQLLQVLDALDLIDTASSVGAYETALATLMAADEKKTLHTRYRAPTKNGSEFDF